MRSRRPDLSSCGREACRHVQRRHSADHPASQPRQRLHHGSHRGGCGPESYEVQGSPSIAFERHYFLLSPRALREVSPNSPGELRFPNRVAGEWVFFLDSARFRGDAGQGGAGSAAVSPGAASPRCFSTDERCEPRPRWSGLRPQGVRRTPGPTVSGRRYPAIRRLPC